MAKKAKTRQARNKGSDDARPAPRRRFRPFRWLFRWIMRLFFGAIAVVLLAVIAIAAIDPPITPYMYQERQRLDEIRSEWVDLDEIAPVMARSAVAAEDANFCEHWGLDLDAIRQAMEDGAVRGASTISQQTVKNVYLWHGRSYVRKAVEALLTPVVEAVWSKRRILEVYLNVAEFDEGVFGVQAAAQHYFGVDAADLSAVQAARLAAVLPNPKNRSASNPSSFVRSRAASIADGAATILADGRAACFSGDRD
ncbi:monofunctional biosynthetic peptidoglycan transglycosylase [Ponticoccus sp. SC2-23]|uniref:monofunctional biosynthetic peptidoglycan transglycosylase n=1 Tax=Alexandriicola marinus TaxID=2081710 RepID=UPI000FDABF86|nr:monofunctional biosynthetic peptidoglycan transglycosylase [Alexandriicola marinus]MBM1220637.1 monofunctional biosynthetic peptidoglycan transglycosylase [Ponticoccus sp. SC6-9]MBM1225323.1 monofunctional biosynthetic peptidoglycan transglycosylase [Ponticoccus sp. SC6-15]MBM1228837.1 monofunctional biosynthetic peptidoglycan transglycosylase [Ponticoccus sp. SC6-38]MBM1233526.1 monofunctional biosynthetic peptidoglycan transglycosylase [Ponticoccus sp. SC6-45]MBM1239338.1 monofunctional b